MQFGAPELFRILWLMPAVVFFYIFVFKKREKVLGYFAQKELVNEILDNYNERKKKYKAAMIVTALLLMLIAVLRPQWGFDWREVKRQGIDIIIALDTSNSMLAEDVLPNRLERSKLAIKDLVRKLKGDRIGLIAFSGTAFLQCPLTVDYNGFLITLDDVTIDTIPIGGTSISNAVDTAVKSYEGGEKKNKILIIITDGEDLEGGVERAVVKAKGEGLKVFCVGIGTEEGELIPVRDELGKVTFLKDAEGNVVKTRLDETVLQSAAIETGGMYVRSTGAQFGLDIIYDQRLAKLEKEAFKSKLEKQYKEKYRIPLTLAFILLLLELFIGEKHRSAKLLGTGPRTFIEKKHEK